MFAMPPDVIGHSYVRGYFIIVIYNSYLIISSLLYYRIASSILKASCKSLVDDQHFAGHSSRFLISHGVSNNK